MARKQRSDKGKKRGSYKWSFANEIRKRTTNFNKTIDKIVKNEFKKQVEFEKEKAENSGVKKLVRDIKAEINKSGYIEQYREALMAGYREHFELLETLKNEELSATSQHYFLDFINTDVGIGGFSLTQEGNFGLRALELFKDRAGDWNKVVDISQGMTLEELLKFREFLIADGTLEKSDNFFYKFLDPETSEYTNQEVIDKILEYYNKRDIENATNDAINKEE